jgi:hypothetical protein
MVPVSEQDEQILNTRTENNFIYGTRQWTGWTNIKYENKTIFDMICWDCHFITTLEITNVNGCLKTFISLINPGVGDDLWVVHLNKLQHLHGDCPTIVENSRLIATLSSHFIILICKGILFFKKIQIKCDLIGCKTLCRNQSKCFKLAPE